MMLDGAEECQLSGPIGELVPYSYQPDGTFADWPSGLIGVLRPRLNSLRSGCTTQIREDVPSLAVGKLPTSARQLSRFPHGAFRSDTVRDRAI